MTFREQWRLALFVSGVGFMLALVTGMAAMSSSGHWVYPISVFTFNASVLLIFLMYGRTVLRHWWFKSAIKDHKLMDSKIRKYVLFGKKVPFADAMFNDAAFRWFIRADKSGGDLDGVFEGPPSFGSMVDEAENPKSER